MRYLLRASLLAPLLAAATAASAADLPRRTAPVDYYAPPPIFSWTGFYAGLNAGASLGSYTGGSYQLFGNNPAGVIGGVTAGYNYQVAPNLIIGAEGDISGSSYKSSNALPFFGFAGGAQMNALFTARGRVGYSMDRALFYVTGGLAVASVNAYINDIRGFPFWGSQSTWQTGYTVGGGLEYAFYNNLSAKIEYLYTSTGADDYFAYSRDYTRLGNSFSTLRAGINYHF